MDLRILRGQFQPGIFKGWEYLFGSEMEDFAELCVMYINASASGLDNYIFDAKVEKCLDLFCYINLKVLNRL